MKRVRGGFHCLIASYQMSHVFDLLLTRYFIDIESMYGMYCLYLVSFNLTDFISF